MYSTVQKFRVSRILYLFFKISLMCSLIMQSFSQNTVKTIILKYFYNLKKKFFIAIYFKSEFSAAFTPAFIVT